MKKLKITMTNPNSCLSHYVVEYKRGDEVEYNTVIPYPETNTFIVPDLATGAYNFRIKAVCCTGSESNTVSLNTTL